MPAGGAPRIPERRTGLDAVKFDAVDVGIITCLQRDARMPVAAVASRLRIPESTARHRINRLVKSGALEFTVQPNPIRLGYQIWAVLEIQVELPKLRSVAARLKAAPEVIFLGLVTGAYDIYAAAIFPTTQEMLDFITHRLAEIPGIVRTSTSTILELVKRTVAYPLPPSTLAVTGKPRSARAVRPRARAAGRSARPAKRPAPTG